MPSATPSPSPTATPTPTPIPTPTLDSDSDAQIPTATPKPSPSPTAPPATLSLEAVRALPIGSAVRTTGVVVAEDGRLGSPTLLGIGDAAGGLVVHLPSGAGTYPRGTRLDVTGKLAAPYGQLEIRPAKADIHVIGSGGLPPSTAIPSAGLTEPLEGRLVTATGRLTAKPKKSASGDLTFLLERDGAAAVKVMADASSRIGNAAFQLGATYRVTGFVGQRATRSGALDGYRIWVRDPADVIVVTAATASPGTTPGSGSPAPGATHDRVHLDRASTQDHRSPGLHRCDRHRARDASRREWPADRRPGRLGCCRAVAADGFGCAAGGLADPCRGSDRSGVRGPAPSSRQVHRRRGAGLSRRRSSSTLRPRLPTNGASCP